MRPSAIIAGCAVASASALLPQGTHAQGTLPKLSLQRPEWTFAEPFSDIAAVRVLENGSIVVSDTREVQVRLVSANGATSRVIGRRGSGPGEYERASRLVALPSDSTLIVDRDARRYLLVDGGGRIVTTQRFPDQLADGAENIVAADATGRVLFRGSLGGAPPGTKSEAPIGRWRRGAEWYDTVAMVSIENPKVEPLKVPGINGNLVAQRRVVFAAVDDWCVARSGRIAVMHASPYRVDWIELNGTRTVGVEVPYTPVQVTEKDKQTYEPKGPPFIRPYASTKSPFVSGSAVTDEVDNVWIRRFAPYGAATNQWDAFSARGRHLGSIAISSGRRLVAITRTHAYAVRVDDDGLEWLERYVR